MQRKQNVMQKNNFSRFLPIKGAYNFRDLGGYVGAKSYHVKWRKIIRSGDFSNICDDDIAVLENLPIKAIVDFRATEEVQRCPDVKLKSASSLYSLNVNDGNLVPDFLALQANQTLTDLDIQEKGDMLMKGLYINLVEKQTDVYKELFAILQREETPLLFHCTAGKDRTGVGAALILYALGVQMSDIFADYLITNDALKGKYEFMNEQYGKIVSFFQTVKKEYLDSAFQYIIKNHISIDNYLKTQLNVDLDKMRNLYLE